MPKSTASANGLVNLILRNTDFTNVGDAGGLRGSATAGNLYVALHTALPAVGDAQNVSEISYTGYARVSLARATTWGAASAGQSFVAANIDFPPSTGGTGGTVTHFSISAHPTTGASGAAPVLYAGVVSPTIAVANGVTPRLTTSTSIAEA